MRARALPRSALLSDIPASVSRGFSALGFFMTDTSLTAYSEPFARVISIGGTGVFGMNCLLIQTPKTQILVDCGVCFPADTDLGVDLITPDFSLVERNPPTALLVTHAHEDHIGAIPYLIMAIVKNCGKFKLPIYASDFTLALIKRRLDEHDLTKYAEFNIARSKDIIAFGDMTAEFIDVCHSIPGSFAFAFKTPVGCIIHSGDWRIDNTPMVGAKTNLARFEALGDEGIRLFLSDSTNVEVDNSIITSELDVFNDIQKCIKDARGRVFITLFASNIGRLQSIVYAAGNTGRKLVLCGRSLVTNLATARELGYIKVPQNVEILREEDIDEKADNLVFVVSGSQGEKTASLFRISQGIHSKIKLRPTDTLIYSARQIPGNERRVDAIINGFYRQGASLVDRPDLTFHSSGHGCQRELELLIELTDPQIFIPVHGDRRRLTLHEQLAQNLTQNMKTEIIEEGRGIVLFKDSYKICDCAVLSHRYVVGKCPNGITAEIMKDKKNMAHQGLLAIAGAIDANDELIGDLRVHAIGICADDGWLTDLPDELKRTVASSARHGDLQEIVRHKAAKYIKSAIGRFPTIIVDLIRV